MSVWWKVFTSYYTNISNIPIYINVGNIWVKFCSACACSFVSNTFSTFELWLAVHWASGFSQVFDESVPSFCFFCSFGYFCSFPELATYILVKLCKALKNKLVDLIALDDLVELVDLVYLLIWLICWLAWFVDLLIRLNLLICEKDTCCPWLAVQLKAKAGFPQVLKALRFPLNRVIK